MTLEPLIFRFSLISENELTTIFPSFDPSLLRMIPYLQGQHCLLTDSTSSVLMRFLVKSSRAKLYWDEDVERTLSQLERHKRLVTDGIPGAEDALERFKQQCEAEVEERMEVRRICSVVQNFGLTSSHRSMPGVAKRGRSIVDICCRSK